MRPATRRPSFASSPRPEAATSPDRLSRQDQDRGKAHRPQRYGLWPIVQGAQLLALRHGVARRSTAERIEGVRALGSAVRATSPPPWRRMSASFRLILRRSSPISPQPARRQSRFRSRSFRGRAASTGSRRICASPPPSTSSRANSLPRRRRQPGAPFDLDHGAMTGTEKRRSFSRFRNTMPFVPGMRRIRSGCQQKRARVHRAGGPRASASW